MTQLRAFFSDTMLGSLVILPMALIALLYNWLMGHMKTLIEPVKPFLPDFVAKSDFLSTALLLGITLLLVFFLGLLLRTSLGRFIHRQVESRILIPYAPGYRFIVESVRPFLPSNKSKPFKRAVIAKPFGDNSYVLGFVTDEFEGQITDLNKETLLTIYVATAPVPTSGITYHVPARNVEELHGISVDEVIRTVIGCGVGTAELLRKHYAKK